MVGASLAGSAEQVHKAASGLLLFQAFRRPDRGLRLPQTHLNIDTVSIMTVTVRTARARHPCRAVDSSTTQQHYSLMCD